MMSTTRVSRRVVLAGSMAALPSAMASHADAQTSVPKKNFVLVHGAWHGGWCWVRVADRLRQQGHNVFTPTLTGLGERSHLISPQINLDTQIADVVNVIKWEDLKDVVLVGHSYGGCVISGVAEIVGPVIENIVYLDAYMPEHDQALIDMTNPTNAETYKKLAAEGTPSPARPARLFNVNERDQSWVDAKCTAHPAGCFVQKIRMTGARDRIKKKTFILATGWSTPFRAKYEQLKQDTSWRTFEVASGHDVMIDQPDELTKILRR